VVCILIHVTKNAILLSGGYKFITAPSTTNDALLRRKPWRENTL
jgi:hypothetical protein